VTSFPTAKQPKLSLKEALRREPTQALAPASGTKQFQRKVVPSRECGRETERNPQPVTRGEKYHPHCHQGGQPTQYPSQPCLDHRISKTHSSEKRASRSDCKGAVGNSNPRVEAGILESRTQLKAINSHIEGSKIRSILGSTQRLLICTEEGCVLRELGTITQTTLVGKY